MIIYATKQTIERYRIVLPQDMHSPIREMALAAVQKESGDRLLEWGAKLFYFDRRKCLQVVNFASKLTLFLFDVKVDDLSGVGNAIAQYLLDIYSNNATMTKLLKRFFDDYPVVAFDRLADKRAIATLNHTQLTFADDGYRFFDFIENNVLQTKKINKKVNFDWIFTEKIDGKTDYFYSGEKFEQLLKERYK
ncbi:MAG: hypothetical protein II896_07780 [Clostridia bacterium]|nr:hypothetical protein [Clostridia bacterium]